MIDDTLLALSAVELRRRIGAREISPVELLQACIDRIEQVNPAVNAITASCSERARQEARAAESAVRRGEPLGALHGLPLGVKDLEDTGGLLTTYGSPGYRNHVPLSDNLLVARLRAAGAIVVGKTNIPEMGAGANSRNPVWGATGNPFNPQLNAGGSSGGSAAALACDMLPLCTGSDTGGSLRIPAALCGVVGFRPSPGLVPVERRQLGWTPISVVGPMGRSVADACLQLSATVAVDDCDPLSYERDGQQFTQLRPVDLAGLRVAYTEDFGICLVDEEIRQAFRSKIAAMRHLFARCDEVRIEAGDADRCFDIVRAESFVAAFREAYERDAGALGPNVRANYEIGANMTLADRAWAHLEQTRIFRKFQQLYRDYDLVLAPVTPVSPFPWARLYAEEVQGRKTRNYYHWLGLTYVVTLMTNPALALPCGTDPHGMPFGLQVIGPHRGDRRLLECGLALEQAFAHVEVLRRPRPDLAALAHPVPELRAMATHPPRADLCDRALDDEEARALAALVRPDGTVAAC
ncbi:amidase [Candidimonas nitroreducens]|uniref:Amidase n=1 Tax=Candidimonas nitroreducens TaxID=683354 RepID=A0A225MB68_9BURK|nr:amidase family protein [Candidimonas nitroreducens]OWT58456.1 amidase [Candidimonas nitroreducens]